MFNNMLPVVFDVISNPTSVTIQVEKRKVRFDDAINPTTNNAWVYSAVTTPGVPATTVLDNYLGPVINVQQGKLCKITWINTLGPMSGMPDMLEPPPINPQPMGPDMQPSVGVVAHLHGGKVTQDSDGFPLDPVGYVSNPYSFPTSRTYTYPNDQRAAMLWFHDHAMDNTAPQVHAGLAGLYFVRDQSDDALQNLIGAKHEIPLVLQDRNLACGYQAMNYASGIPSDASYARPEFLGESIFVNGRASPVHELVSGYYRLRVLNGSNARTYALALIDPHPWSDQPVCTRVWYSDRIRVIGNEAGLLTKSVQLQATDYLLLAPGERLDLLIDLRLPTSPSIPGRSVPTTTSLRLVNLAVKSALSDGGPEGIFQNDVNSVVSPLGSNVPGPVDMNDKSLLNQLNLRQAQVMQFCIFPPQLPFPVSAAVTTADVDAVLAAHTDDENFAAVDGEGLGPVLGAMSCPTNFVFQRSRRTIDARRGRTT